MTRFFLPACDMIVFCFSLHDSNLWICQRYHIVFHSIKQCTVDKWEHDRNTVQNRFRGTQCYHGADRRSCTRRNLGLLFPKYVYLQLRGLMSQDIQPNRSANFKARSSWEWGSQVVLLWNRWGEKHCTRNCLCIIIAKEASQKFWFVVTNKKLASPLLKLCC